MTRKQLIFLLSFTIILLFNYFSANAEIKIGNQAPKFVLEDLNNKRISLDQIISENKPIILSFFATWCKPCLKEIAILENVGKKYDINIYLVNIDNIDKDKVKEFVESKKIRLNVLVDREGIITGYNYGIISGGIASVPKLFIISGIGEIKYISKGFEANLEQILDEQITDLKAKSSNDVSKLTIFFTNSTNGYLESCDCPMHPYGGLVRRATLLNKQQKTYPNNLLIDSGDLLPPYVSEIQAEYLFKIYDVLKYDTVCIGDQELSYDKFITEIKKYKIPFLASNLNYCDDTICRFITPNKYLFNKDGIEVAVISIIHPDVFILYPEKVTKKINIISYKDIISNFISQNKNKYDILILVSHSGIDVDKQIAVEFPDIDVIIGGHSQTLLMQPYKIGKTLIVQAGKNAENVGRLTLEFDSNKKIGEYKYEITPLTKDIPDDPQIRKLITEYKQKFKKK